MEHHFFAYISRMKFIRRWGLMRNAVPENDMEHALQAALFAHAIGLIGVKRYQRTYNPEHLMALAAYHDACEVITGDMPTPIKHHNPILKAEYHKLEEIAAKKLLSMLPPDIRGEYEELICQSQSDEEKKIVKAADKLCAYVKCLEEKKVGNAEFEQARKSTQEALQNIDLPEVQDFIRECVPGFSLTLDEISENISE